MFLEPFTQGCYSLISDPNGYVQSNFIPLHKNEDSYSAWLGALGTYDLPAACRRYCYNVFATLLVIITDYKCHCLAKTNSLSDVQNLQSFESPQTCANSEYLLSDNLQRGFSVLNPTPDYEEDLPIPAHYCGSIENGGVYKCGTTEASDDPYATVYGFTNFDFSDRTYQEFKNMNFKIFGVQGKYDSTRPVALHEPVEFTITIPFCPLPYYLSDDGTECLSHHIPIWILFTFGDGTEYETYLYSYKNTGMQLLHYYNETGEYEVKLTSRVGPVIYSGLVRRLVRIYQEVDGFFPDYINVSHAVTGEETKAMPLVLQGTEFSCTVDYGDDTLQESYYYANIQEVDTLYHRYRKAGLYTITMECTNDLRSDIITGIAVVQDIAAAIQTTVDTAISYKDFYEHTWSLVQGTHVTCNVYYGDRLLAQSSTVPDSNNIGSGSFLFDDDTNEGIALLPVPNNKKFGLYTVVVTCHNIITTKIPVAISYLTFETPLDNIEFKYLNTDPYFEANEAISLSLSIGEGSNFFTYWHWPVAQNGVTDAIEYCHDEDCKSR